MKTFRDLTVPDRDSTSAREVLGQYLRHNLTALFGLPMGRFHARRFDDFADARAHLQRLLRSGNAGLVFSLTRQVTHSTLVQCLDRELRGGGNVDRLDGWLTELCAATLLELAAERELPEDGLLLRERPARLLSLRQNLELTLDAPWSLGFRPGRVVLVRGTERVELPIEGLAEAPLPEGVRARRPYHRIDDGVFLGEADNNPLWDQEAHPDKFGNALDLGGHPVEEWLASLRASLALVDRYLPDLGREIRLTLQAVVPVGYHAERHLSASYAEAVGLIYLTLHPDPMTMTEALIHEFSHNKLNARCAEDGQLQNAFHPLFASPVRPDPRPLHGVLLAVHAFVPVARLYEAMLDDHHPWAEAPHFQARYQKILAGNHEGTTTLLTHGVPTPGGGALLEELARWDRHYAPRRDAAADAPGAPLSP